MGHSEKLEQIKNINIFIIIIKSTSCGYIWYTWLVTLIVWGNKIKIKKGNECTVTDFPCSLAPTRIEMPYYLKITHHKNNQSFSSFR